MRITFIRIILYIAVSSLSAQGTWQWSGRVHPELEWNTIETEHFNVHYHNGIEAIARQGASIAEQVWPTLLKQMDLEKAPKIDITFTSEDEIMNGYALWSNMVFIWVDQNDAALWLEDEKWLYQVVAHELQHIALFLAIKTWLPMPWSYLISGTPGWFVEGSAEYYTEKWRPYRADLSHKWHVLKNKMKEMDPHHDGYSKLLYLSDRFGDSTLVKIVKYRDKVKLFDFKKAFKEATGVPLKQFEEDWRRQMNTYYYGYRAQKETIEEIGRPFTLPVKTMRGFYFAPDSLKIAIVGRNDEDQRDFSLFIATRDTTRKKEPVTEKISAWIRELFAVKKDSTAGKKKPKIKWDLKEVDYGSIHSQMSWSPDASELVYAKYHYGKNQSMIWDIRKVNVETGKGKWLTRSFRANQPDWSPDGKQIVFVAHKNNTSNLYSIKTDGSGQTQLTQYKGDTQLLTPRWSPEGKRIAYAVADPEGRVDLVVLDVETGETRRITDFPAVDYDPVWHPDGKRITFTSHEGGTPNLYTVDLLTDEIVQTTDVGDAVWSTQWTPKDSTIIATTLNDVDSVRVVQVSPRRQPDTSPLSLRKTFTRWRTIKPEHLLTRADPFKPVKILDERPYRFWKHIKPFLTFAFPYLDGSGMFGLVSFTDAMGRHIFEISSGRSWTGDPNPWLYLGYTNAQNGPLWGVNYFYNSRWSFRYYDRSASGLYQRLDGWQFWTQIPVNFGSSMSSNHRLRTALTLQNRLVLMPSDSIDANTGEFIPRDSSDFIDLPVPQEGKEGMISLAYRWLDRRPNRKNIILPTQGKGFQVRMNHVNKNLYGDFTYTKFTTDGFVNLPGGGSNALFLRVKTMAMVGTPPAQEYVGLSRDPAIYMPGGIADEGIFGFQENYNPRGWDGVRLGDRMVFGSLEYRFPLVKKLPIDILGFTLGSVTGALISDFGNAWYVGKTVAPWIVTGGYELKVALQMGKSPLLIFSLGHAQLLEEWQDDKEPVSYFRLALINPF
ncbi:MAG: hypothetical protein GXO92_03320 [FCB group bacterium]|nr:hypothetical protein [FCB group bacterium]